MSEEYCGEWKTLPEPVKELILAEQKTLPVKLGRIAAALGLDVKIATLEIGISGEIFPHPERERGFKIRINKHEVTTRQRFTLAHEIAHFLLHRSLIGNGIVDNILFRSRLSNTNEAEANRLAADILMPRAAIKEWKVQNPNVGKTDSVVPLATMFGVSEDALKIRIGLK